MFTLFLYSLHASTVHNKLVSEHGMILVSWVKGGVAATCGKSHIQQWWWWKDEIKVELLMQNQDGWWHKNLLKKKASYTQDKDWRDWWFEGFKLKHGDVMIKGTQV